MLIACEQLTTSPCYQRFPGSGGHVPSDVNEHVLDNTPSSDLQKTLFKAHRRHFSTCFKDMEMVQGKEQDWARKSPEEPWSR